MRPLFPFIVLAAPLTLLVGCAASSASINTFIEPGLDISQLHRIAVFPVRNTAIVPSEARQLNRDISQAINRRKPSIVIISSAEVIDVLNQKGLVDEWARFIDTYNSSGIPNSGLLKEIGSALGVDAILQGEVLNIHQVDGVYGGNKGTTRVTVRYSMIGVSEGKLLWEASSDGFRTTVTTVEPAPPLIQAIKLAQDKILSTLPF